MAPVEWSTRGEVWTVGDPEESSVAVVCGVHGDEPCGKRAVERVVATYGRPEGVTFVLANPRAHERGRRYVDADLNRSFPGDPDSDLHERRLAARLVEALGDHLVLDLHSTVSRPTPFALFQRRNDRVYDAVRNTGVDRVVDVASVDGGMVGELDGVAVEVDGGMVGELDGVAVEVDGTDLQRGTEAAYGITVGFLAAYGLVDAAPRRSDPVVYRVYDEVPKRHDGSEVHARNFERVAAGEVVARGERGTVRADDAFYPVLISGDGYDGIHGFRATREGRISETCHRERRHEHRG